VTARPTTNHNAGVVSAVVVLLRCVFHEPVEDASDKRGDERDLGLSASYGLVEVEEQSHVAVNAVLRLELFCRLHTFPGRGKLYQDALLGYSLQKRRRSVVTSTEAHCDTVLYLLFVELYQRESFLYGGLLVK
jgi:hypothetical protein